MQNPYWTNKQIMKIRAPGDYLLKHVHKMILYGVKKFTLHLCVNFFFFLFLQYVCVDVHANEFHSVGGWNICSLAASYP